MKFWKKSEAEDNTIKRPYVLWFLAVLLLLTTVVLVILANLPDEKKVIERVPQTTTTEQGVTTTVPGSITVLGPDGKRIVVAPGQEIPEGSKSLTGISIPPSITVPALPLPLGSGETTSTTQCQVVSLLGVVCV